MTAPLLEVNSLTVQRGGVEVLNIPTFALLPNEITAIIGPNGAGKTTLLLALAQLLGPCTGNIRYRGAEIVTNRDVLALRRRMAMVFQEPLLFDATVFDNIASGLVLRRIPKREIQARVMETLDLFKIQHLAGRSARKLSGGEAQRTSLARAFAIQPEMILLDEPFAALDPPTRLALMEDLERILRETSTAAVLTTHDQMEALRLADRMVVLNQGEIIQNAPPVEVMHCPVDEFVAAFVGMENVLSGEVIDEQCGLLTVKLADVLLELAGIVSVGDSAVFCIRPEHVTIETHNPAGETSARNVFPAVIRKVIPTGAFHKIVLDCGFPLVAYLTNQSIGNLHLEPGKEIFASFKATAVHLIRSTGRGSEIGHGASGKS